MGIPDKIAGIGVLAVHRSHHDKKQTETPLNEISVLISQMLNRCFIHLFAFSKTIYKIGVLINVLL